MAARRQPENRAGGCLWVLNAVRKDSSYNRINTVLHCCPSACSFPYRFFCLVFAETARTEANKRFLSHNSPLSPNIPRFVNGQTVGRLTAWLRQRSTQPREMKAASSEGRFSMDKRPKVPIERHLRGTLVRLREQKRMKRRRCKGTRMVPNTQTGPPRKRTATARHTSIEACRDAHAQLELIAGVATSDHRTDSFFFFFTNSTDSKVKACVRRRHRLPNLSENLRFIPAPLTPLLKKPSKAKPRT